MAGVDTRVGIAIHCARAGVRASTAEPRRMVAELDNKKKKKKKKKNTNTKKKKRNSGFLYQSNIADDRVDLSDSSALTLKHKF